LSSWSNWSLLSSRWSAESSAAIFSWESIDLDDISLAFLAISLDVPAISLASLAILLASSAFLLASSAILLASLAISFALICSSKPAALIAVLATSHPASTSSVPIPKNLLFKWVKFLFLWLFLALL